MCILYERSQISLDTFYLWYVCNFPSVLYVFYLFSYVQIFLFLFISKLLLIQAKCFIFYLDSFEDFRTRLELLIVFNETKKY